MAKIAGRKNDGAWYRWNKWIIDQPTATQTAFMAYISTGSQLSDGFQAVQSYMADVGVQASAFPATQDEWALELSIGIPRQIWDGVTTYDFYDKTGSGDTAKYTKLMQVPVFQLSKLVREAAKAIRFGETEVGGLAGLARPPAVALQRADEPKSEYRARRRVELTHYWAEHGEAMVAARKKHLTTRRDESISTVLAPRHGQPKGGRKSMIAAALTP